MMMIRTMVAWAVFLTLNQAHGFVQSTQRTMLLHKHKFQAVNDYDVIVIGAGVGGLSTAARLAAGGKKVRVVEMNEETRGAGRLGQINVEGYRFESGPSLLLLPDIYEEAFMDSQGADLFTNDIDIQPVKGGRYHIFFDDGRRPMLLKPPLILRGGLEGFEHDCKEIDALERASGSTNGEKKYAEHMLSSQRILDGGLTNLIEEKLDVTSLLGMFMEILRGNWPLTLQVC